MTNARLWAVKHPLNGKYLSRATAHCSRPTWTGRLGIGNLWEMKSWAKGAADETAGTLIPVAVIDGSVG